MRRMYQNKNHSAFLAPRGGDDDDGDDGDGPFRCGVRIAICFHLLRRGIKTKIINLFDWKPKNRRRSRMQMKFSQNEKVLKYRFDAPCAASPLWKCEVCNCDGVSAEHLLVCSACESNPFYFASTLFRCCGLKTISLILLTSRIKLRWLLCGVDVAAAIRFVRCSTLISLVRCTCAEKFHRVHCGLHSIAAKCAKYIVFSVLFRYTVHDLAVAGRCGNDLTRTHSIQYVFTTHAESSMQYDSFNPIVSSYIQTYIRNVRMRDVYLSR